MWKKFSCKFKLSCKSLRKRSLAFLPFGKKSYPKISLSKLEAVLAQAIGERSNGEPQTRGGAKI